MSEQQQGTGLVPSEARGLRLAYLNSEYPALSHTFIEREILTLRECGAEVHTFSVRPCAKADLRSELMRTEYANTKVLLGGDIGLWVRSHLGLLREHPKAWFGSLLKGLRSGDKTPRAKLWQLFYFGEAGVLHHLLSEVDVRHVHVHHANVAADVARRVCDLGNRIDGPDTWSWSMTVHGPTEWGMVEAWDIPAKLREVEQVTTVSDFSRAMLMNMVEPAQWAKIDTIHMTVDPELFSPPASRKHDGPMRVLSVGRLVHLKGFPVLVEAIAELRRRGIDVETTIIGQGPAMEDLQKLIVELGVADLVTLAGAVGQDHIVEYYHWADVYVSPSFAEVLPVVLMEGMATEIPVVATRIAAIEELVRDKDNGRVLPAGRIDLLADALAELAADPQLREKMGKRGRETVLAGFVPEVTGPQMARFMNRAVNHSGATQSLTDHTE